MLFHKIGDIKKPFQNGRVFIEMKMLFIGNKLHSCCEDAVGISIKIRS